MFQREQQKKQQFIHLEKSRTTQVRPQDLQPKNKKLYSAFSIQWSPLQHQMHFNGNFATKYPLVFLDSQLSYLVHLCLQMTLTNGTKLGELRQSPLNYVIIVHCLKMVIDKVYIVLKTDNVEETRYTKTFMRRRGETPASC